MASDSYDPGILMRFQLSMIQLAAAVRPVEQQGERRETVELQRLLDHSSGAR